MSESRSITVSMAHRYGMEVGPFEATIRATVVPDGIGREQFAAFLLVANEHDLNPITREIFAMKGRKGGIIPIVSVDGWASIINRRPELDGIQFVDEHDDDGKLISTTCKIWRKDRSHPVEITEYLSECKRDTEPWNKWPHRMLRHKSLIQCARIAFAISGIIEPDEAERYEGGVTEVKETAPREYNEVDVADPETGEVTTEERPIPLEKPTTGGSETSSTGVTQTKPLNPEDWLDGIEKEFDRMTAEDVVGGIWKSLVNMIEAKRGELFPADYEAAMTLANKTKDRLSSTKKKEMK